jgi:hypothetical protein
MDYFHLDITKIQLHVQDGKIDHDTIFGDIKNLACHEKCGLNILAFKSNARVSTSDITCRNLLIRTDNSVIQNYLQFRYDSFPDFKSFITKVNMQASLHESEISLHDINYFARGALSNIDHNRIKITGEIKGKVNNFHGKEIIMKLAQRTTFVGDFSFRGLPNFKETLISLRVGSLESDPHDVQRIYPHLPYPPNFQTLGNMTFTGDFDGFVSDFVTQGRLNTSIGAVTADLNFKLPEGKQPTYSGNLSSTQFNLGKWFNREDILGAVTLQANIKGSGLKIANVNATLKGKVDQIEVKGYNYKGIDIDGTFDNKTFKGQLAVTDEQVDLKFNGLVNLSDSLPQFVFKAQIDHADLQALHLVNRPLQISGVADINFSGKKLDDIAGEIQLSNFNLRTDTSSYPISSLHLNSYKSFDGSRFINISSGIVDGEVSGHFNFTQLPTIFKAYLEHYALTPKYERLDTMMHADLNFNIRIYDPGSMTRLIHPAFRLVRNSVISGKFNSSTQLLTLEGNIPQLIYASTDFRGIKISANSTPNGYVLSAGFSKMLIKDSTWVRNLEFNANYAAEKRFFNFSLYAEADTNATRVKLGGIVAANDDRLIMRLNNSSVFLNNNEWIFRPDNMLAYSKNRLDFEHVILFQGEKELYISTFHPQDSITNLEFDLKNISVADLSKLIDHTNNKYYGSADGSFEIRNLFHTPSYFGNLYIANLGVNNDTLGNLSMYSDITDIKEKIPVEIKLRGKYNDVNITGNYSPSKSGNKLNFEADIKRLRIDVINNYLSQYVSNSTGTLTGKLTVSGTDKKPVIDGAVFLQRCYTTVAYINCRYYLDNEMITFKENEISLNNIAIRDENKNIGYGGGKIRHNYLKDFYLDLYVNAENLQMLKTNQNYNPIFWGTGYGTGVALFKGPIRDMTIHVEATTTKGSTLTIPVRSSVETSNYSFYRFIKAEDTTAHETKKVRPKEKLHVELDLEMTPDAEVTLLLDPVAGDNLKVNGEGKIAVTVNENADLSVKGEYIISRGNYFFTLPTLVNKSFTIDKGSTIKFPGDVYQAQLDVSAIYSVRTMPYELIQESVNGADADVIAKAKKRVPVDLLLYLKGPLSRPEISFDINMKDLDPALQNFVNEKLTSMKTNTNELNKQVAGLLLTSSFFPSVIGTNSASSTASSTVSEFLSSQISKYLSSLLGSFVPGLDFVVSYRPYSTTDASGKSSLNGNEVYFGVNQKFLNNRITLNVGGNVNLNKQLVNTNRFNGDFSLEYQVTKDGRLRLKAFNRSDIDYYTPTEPTTNVKTGLGVSYHEEFDNWADLRQQYRERRQRKLNLKKQKILQGRADSTRRYQDGNPPLNNKRVSSGKKRNADTEIRKAWDSLFKREDENAFQENEKPGKN